MTRAAALASETALWQRAQKDQQRLALADAAYERGEIRVASRIYWRLSQARPPSEVAAVAAERLEKLAREALARQAKIDATLSGDNMRISPHELYAGPGDKDRDERVAEWEETVRSAFEQYDRLIGDYENMPAVGRQLKSHVKGQRGRTEIAAVLEEPEARALLDVAEGHEAERHVCCAYWVYRQAARLALGALGRKAQARAAELEKDPQAMAAARACREMQLCHRLYNRANLLLPSNPDRAREIFAEVVQRAPKDTELYRAAKLQRDKER